MDGRTPLGRLLDSTVAHPGTGPRQAGRQAGEPTPTARPPVRMTLSPPSLVIPKGRGRGCPPAYQPSHSKRRSSFAIHLAQQQFFLDDGLTHSYPSHHRLHHHPHRHR